MQDDHNPPDRAVKLRGTFTYDSGSHYRVWTLLRDLPELALANGWHEDVGGPGYAVAGDELWEDKDDRSQVFRLKRDEYVVARPEWWQVEHIFGSEWQPWKKAPERPAAIGLLRQYEYESDGRKHVAWMVMREYAESTAGGDSRSSFVIPAGAIFCEIPAPAPWNKAHMLPWGIFPPKSATWNNFGIAAQDAHELLRIDKVERTSEYRAALRALGARVQGDGTYHGLGYAFVEGDVSGVVRRGDVLVYAKDVGDRPTVRGVVRELGLAEYALLADAISAAPRTLTDITPAMRNFYAGTVERLLHDKQRWGLRLKNWHSRLLRVRPVYRETVSEPVEALSDDHALFALLSDVGGRWPKVGAP
ncbi:MAG TPA: hypothetical protein VMN60_00510 [Longimicrobiales bacterium]|nr:hypothetical protein [Longimicrobiales bacterium]